MIRAWLLALLCAVMIFVPLAVLVATAHARCRTHACWHRVSVRRHVEFAWRWVKAHPMPACTWIPESGEPRRGYGEFARARYRVKNTSRGTTAAGKYQAIDKTFHYYGGPDYPGTHDAAKAPPLLQEKIARRILNGQGLGAWSRCA